jgi:hypothetical protein
VETKICSKCKVEKLLENFVKKNNSPDGCGNTCNQCNNERGRKYRIKNKEKIKNYYIENKEKHQSYKKEHYTNNREKIKSNSKEYYIKNKEKQISQKKEYYIKNREKKLSKQKEYNIKNKENLQSYRNEYERNRKLNDPIYKLSINVRDRLRKYLKSVGITKNKRTFDIVGCSPPELKEHLEKQFVDGMSWDKMGKKIHIDHIIPLSSAKTEEDIYKLAHYTNLQPLWAEDNLAKSNKLDYLYTTDNPKL